MRVNTKAKPVVFDGESGEKLTLSPSNMGEPYRDGIDLSFESDDQYFGGFLTAQEARKVRDFLNEFINDTE